MRIRFNDIDDTKHKFCYNFITTKPVEQYSDEITVAKYHDIEAISQE